MEPFDIINKWFWALCILVMFANGGIFKYRAKKQIARNPDSEEGYNKIINGFIIWGNIPWVVMGIGCSFGDIPSVRYYFNPKDGNPYVIAFFASVFLIWILGSYWILIRGGAENLVNHPGIFNHDVKSPTIIKLIWIASLLGGIAGVFIMYTQG